MNYCWTEVKLLPFLHDQHHAEEDDDEEQDASDDAGDLHRVIRLFLGLHRIGLPGGGTWNRKSRQSLLKWVAAIGWKYNERTSCDTQIFSSRKWATLDSYDDVLLLVKQVSVSGQWITGYSSLGSLEEKKNSTDVSVKSQKFLRRDLNQDSNCSDYSYFNSSLRILGETGWFNES